MYNPLPMGCTYTAVYPDSCERAGRGRATNLPPPLAIAIISWMDRFLIMIARGGTGSGSITVSPEAG